MDRGMNMNNTTNNGTTNTNKNNQIMKTGNASFDAGVELGVRIGFKQGVEDSFYTNQLNQFNQFTQEELQFLKATISQTITVLHTKQNHLDGYIKDQFNKCNPDDPATYMYFKYLNVLRDVQRAQRADIKKLVGIQKKIKRSLRKNWLGGFRPFFYFKVRLWKSNKLKTRLKSKS